MKQFFFIAQRMHPCDKTLEHVAWHQINHFECAHSRNNQNLLRHKPAESWKVMRALPVSGAKSIFSILPPPDRFVFSNNIDNVSCLKLSGMLLTCIVADGPSAANVPSCRVTRITASLNCTDSLLIIASATVTATVYHRVCFVKFALSARGQRSNHNKCIHLKIHQRWDNWDSLK